MKGFVVILSSPSGGGKSTLAQHVTATVEGVRASVSVTTRLPRPLEVDGRDYLFVSRSQFEERLQAGQFLEHAEVFGNRYGTSRELVEGALAQDEVVVLAIDWQGAAQVRRSMPPEQVVSIYVLPPGPEVLARRLRGRGQDDETVIQGRMARARAEVSHWPDYDYVVINDDLEAAKRQVAAIIQAELLRRSRLGRKERAVLADWG